MILKHYTSKVYPKVYRLDFIPNKSFLYKPPIPGRRIVGPNYLEAKGLENKVY